MSRKRRDDSPMPATTAGLLRFFEDPTEGVNISPIQISAFTVIFVVLSTILWYYNAVGVLP